MQCEERKWLRYVRKVIAEAEGVKKHVNRKRRQVIDKKGEKVPDVGTDSKLRSRKYAYRTSESP